MITFVLDVIFSSILFTLILKVSESGSTGIIEAPTLEIESQEAMYAFEATITSSPFPMFRDFSEIIKASRPLPTPIEYLLLFISGTPIAELKKKFLLGFFQY